MFKGIYTSQHQIYYDREAALAWLQNFKSKNPYHLGDRIRDFQFPSIAYHCRDDRQINEAYGKILHTITSDWEIPALDPHPSGKRWGIVSSNIGATSAAAWMLGIMEMFPDVEWYIYQVGKRIADGVTSMFINKGAKFCTLDSPPRVAMKGIVKDRCNVLWYPDYGFHYQTNLFASARLAPIQVASWGHPVTTGLQTIDYYLSSELYEPKNAQEHYTETLIRLPGIGLPIPEVPQRQPNKRYWELEGYVSYLCVQNPQKYQPQMDYLYHQIAERTRKAGKQPLFIFAKYPLTRNLVGRLAKLDGKFPNRVYQWMPRSQFRSLIASADVFLDTPGWSGANTTAEAIAQGTPIVTTEGAFMRGRVSHGMLQACGMSRTVEIEQYVEAALDKIGRRETPRTLPYDWRAVRRELRMLLLKGAGSPQSPQPESQVVLA